MKRLFAVITMVATLSLLAAQCVAPAATPERIVETVVVEKEVEKVVTREVEVMTRPETVVEFWTTDNEEDGVNMYEAIAERFMAENPTVEVRIVPMEEAGVSQRMATAMAANRLPDIIRMGVERVAPFAADGILDEDAAEPAIRPRVGDRPGSELPPSDL